MKICFSCSQPFENISWCCPSCGYQPPKVGGFPAFAPEMDNSNSGYHPELYDELKILETDNFWFQSRNKLITFTMQRYLPRLHYLLEIGCGTGCVLSAIATAFPETKITGSEIFSAGLSHAADRVPKAEFLQMDARVQPFVEHFDIVCAFDVLEHITEDERVLTEIYKTLKYDGTLILTVPQHPQLWSIQDEAACHVRRYTASELRSKVLNAGFDIIYETSFVSLLLPIMWLSRQQKKRVKQEVYDPLSELRIGRIANSLLSVMMMIERGLIQLGIRFPVGGSRLLVARRS